MTVMSQYYYVYYYLSDDMMSWFRVILKGSLSTREFSEEFAAEVVEECGEVAQEFEAAVDGFVSHHVQ
jgi:hypothetical protein